MNDGATLLYRASKRDCNACELKQRCCPNMPARKVPRSIYESARVAHLKRILRLDRLRLRDPCGAHDEFLLAATVQNLRKLAKLIPLPAPMPA